MLIKICNSFTLLHKEFNQISLVFEKTGHPKSFLNKHINRFMQKHYGKDSPKENIFKDPRVKKFFVCGYHLFAKFTANKKEN